MSAAPGAPGAGGAAGSGSRPRHSPGGDGPLDGTLVHRVIDRLNIGGPAIHVVNLTAGLAREGFRTRLVAGRVEPHEGDMAYYARERGVRIHAVPELRRPVDLRRDAAALWKLYRLFRRERPRVVHTHKSTAGALGRLAAWLAGVPVRIHTFHGHIFQGDYFDDFTTRWFLRIERWMARLSTRIVALTDELADELAHDLRIAPREKIDVIALGFDLEPFVSVDRAGERASLRRELEMDDDTPLVGIVGRLTGVKAHELLFEAAARMIRGEVAFGGVVRSAAVPGTPGGGIHPALEVVVVGGGERERELKDVARHLGIESRVHFLGWRRDLPRIYSGIDVLALSSLNEGTPVAVIEALAAGTPVVATAVGGVPEVLEGGRLGRLVRSRDPGEMAAAIADVLASPPGPEERRTRRRSAVERFGEERLVRDVARLYREALEGSGS